MGNEIFGLILRIKHMDKMLGRDVLFYDSFLENTEINGCIGEIMYHC